ncbi:MAG: hypothetical protein ACYC0H_18475 [Solirubrobacteraceae bacterium]
MPEKDRLRTKANAPSTRPAQLRGNGMVLARRSAWFAVFAAPAAVVGLVSAGPGAAITVAQRPTSPASASVARSGPAEPDRLFDGIIRQAGKRWVFWFTTSKRGWFRGESGNAAFGYPRGERCSTDGRVYSWQALPRAQDHFLMSRVPARSYRRDGTFRYRYRFQHPQDRRITLQEDATGRFSEGGTVLTMRYRWVTTTSRRRCDTGWVSARAAVLRYTAATPDGVAVQFDVKDRTTLMTGELVPNLTGTISGAVPACTTPEAEFPAVAKRWTGVSGEVDDSGAVQLSTDFAAGGSEATPHPAAFFRASGLPEESDRYFPWATGPAQITGTLELGWAGTAEPCEFTKTTLVLRRTHPELALTLPRPGTKRAHAELRSPRHMLVSAGAGD